jgi:hypothetical protein
MAQAIRKREVAIFDCGLLTDAMLKTIAVLVKQKVAEDERRRKGIGDKAPNEFQLITDKWSSICA